MALHVAELLVHVTSDTAGFVGGMKSAEGRLGTFSKGAQALGGSLTKHLTLPIVAIGAVAVHTGMEFEDSMQLLRTSAGASQEEVEHMSKGVLALAHTSRAGGQSLDALGKGMYQIQSAGFRGQKALDLLSAAAVAARVTGADLESTTGTLTSVMKVNARGTGDAAHAMGVLNAIVGAGKMRMDELSAALSSGILPILPQLNVSLPELGAAIGTFTKAGVPAQRAANNLRTALVKMAAPGKAGEKALKGLGIGTDQLAMSLQKGGLTGGLELLRNRWEATVKSFGGGKDAIVKANKLVLQSFGGSKGGATVLGLIQQFESYKKTLEQVGKTTDDYAKSSEKALNLPSSKIHEAFGSIQASMAQVGVALAPAVASIAAGIAAIVTAFDKLPAGGQKAILIFAGIAAAAGPLIAIIGALVSPVGLVVAAIAGLVAALVILDQHFHFIGPAIDYVKQKWDELVQGFSKGTGPFAGLAEGARAALDALKGIFGAGLSVLQALWGTFGDLILDHVKHTWEFIKAYVQAAMQVLRGIINVVMGIIHGDWSQVWQGIQQIVMGVWNGIKAIITFALQTIKTVITAELRAYLAIMTAVWNGIKAAASAAWSAIVSLVSRALSAVASAISSAASTVASAATRLGTGIVRGVASGRSSLVATVAGFFTMVGVAVAGFAGDAFGWALSVGKALMDGISAGIRGAIGAVIGVISSAKNKIKSLFTGGWLSPPDHFTEVMVGAKLMQGIVRGIEAGMPATESAVEKAKNHIKAKLQAQELVALAKQYGSKIGVANAQGIIMGLIQTTPSLLQQARTQMQQMATAQAQAYQQAKAGVISAFDQVANEALSKFDEKTAGGTTARGKALKKSLEGLQLVDTVKQLTDGLGNEVQGAELKLMKAYASGNTKAIKAASDELVTALEAQEAEVTAAADANIAAAQANVDKVNADPASTDADKEQAAADLKAAQEQKITDLATFHEKERALTEANLSADIEQEQRKYDGIVGKQREGLARQLVNLREELLKHPEEWNKLTGKINAILKAAGINVLAPAGKKWAEEFADGIRKGIPEVVRAAHEMAKAAANAAPHSSPAKEGPLAFDMVDVGKRWSEDFARGIRAGAQTVSPAVPKLPSGVDAMLQGQRAAGAYGAGGQPPMQTIVNVTIPNATVLGKDQAAADELARIVGPAISRQIQLVGPYIP